MNKITIYGSTPSKKNSRINTRSGRSFPSSKYTAWHKNASAQLVGIKPIPGGTVLNVTFFAGDNRKFDLSNKLESVMDLFVDLRIIQDDNWSIVPEINLKFGGVEKDNAHCVIEY